MEKTVYISATSCITPLGFDLSSNIDAVLNGESGIRASEKYPAIPSACLGEIDDHIINVNFERIASAGSYTRLEKMLILALHPLIRGRKLTDRSALILSTTKGNIALIGDKNQDVSQANLGLLAKKIAGFFGFTSEPIVVSNACVSGILALSVGKRLLQYSDFTEVFVLAGDEITEFVLSGFSSFQALSDEYCRPYDRNRKGINMGEAAAAAYLSTEKSSSSKVKISGDASVNDANHISGPSRTGEGLFRSMQSAFKESGISPEEVGFISAHGTATLYNDEMESIAFDRMGMHQVPVFSLKGIYGHTLGASGLLEAVLSIEALLLNKIPGSFGFREKGVSGSITVSEKVQDKAVNSFLKTASGFGGSNTAVLFEKIGGR